MANKNDNTRKLEEQNELIRLYSQMNERDRKVFIKLATWCSAQNPSQKTKRGDLTLIAGGQKFEPNPKVALGTTRNRTVLRSV